MNAVTRNLTKSWDFELARSLGNGLNTQKMDNFLDQLFHLAGKLGSVSCTLTNNHALCLQTSDTVLQEVEIPRAKTILRMLCARLAVRCGDWSNRKLSPYGDQLELEFPETKQLYKVSFENTPASQKITIQIGT